MRFSANHALLHLCTPPSDSLGACVLLKATQDILKHHVSPGALFAAPKTGPQQCGPPAVSLQLQHESDTAGLSQNSGASLSLDSCDRCIQTAVGAGAPAQGDSGRVCPRRCVLGSQQLKEVFQSRQMRKGFPGRGTRMAEAPGCGSARKGDACGRLCPEDGVQGCHGADAGFRSGPLVLCAASQSKETEEGGRADRAHGGLQWAPRPSGLPLSLHCWLKVRGREGPMSGKPWAPSLGLVSQGSTPWLSECRRRQVGTACETCR